MDGIFGIGPLELFFIAIIALIVLGPERLPGALRELARTIRRIRELTNEFTTQFGDELKALDEINPRKILSDMTDPGKPLPGDKNDKPLATPQTNKPVATPKPAPKPQVIANAQQSSKAATEAARATKAAREAEAAKAAEEKASQKAAEQAEATAQDTAQADTAQTVVADAAQLQDSDENHTILPPATAETGSALATDAPVTDAPATETTPAPAEVAETDSSASELLDERA